MKNVYLALSEISKQSIHILSDLKKKNDAINSILVMFKGYETEKKSAI